MLSVTDFLYFDLEMAESRECSSDAIVGAVMYLYKTRAFIRYLSRKKIIEDALRQHMLEKSSMFTC